MKTTITIIMLLLSMVTVSQTIEGLYSKYIDHCNELVVDTIEEYGEVEATKEVPIYDGCEQIIGYRSIPAKDTTWKGYKCPEYKVAARGYWLVDTISSETWTQSTLTLENGVIKRKPWPGSCKVSRKHVCHVKREKPSQNGFYEWLWKYLSSQK